MPNLVKLSPCKDKAADAFARLRAAGDDCLYDAACDDVVRMPATSLAGVHAKCERLGAHLEAIEEGNLPTDFGWAEIQSLRAGVSDALSRLGPRR